MVKSWVLYLSIEIFVTGGDDKHNQNSSCSTSSMEVIEHSTITSTLDQLTNLSGSQEILNTDNNMENEKTVEHSPSKRRKHSKVWKYFKKSADKKFAKCLNCKKEYKTSGNTSNLSDHLKRFHADLFTNPDNELDGEVSLPSTSTSTSARSSTRSISPFFKRELQYDGSSHRQKELNRALVLMIARDFQPFNIVNDEGFRNFVQLLNPRYVIPSKFTVRETIMMELYTQSVQVLKAILKNVQHVAVTTDSWTSISNESYITVTCHFVTKDFELKSAVLSTKPLENGKNHTSENLAAALSVILNDGTLKLNYHIL